jgi:hypothetical protein
MNLYFKNENFIFKASKDIEFLRESEQFCQRFKTKHATSNEISFLVRKDEEKFKAQVECPLHDCKKNIQLNMRERNSKQGRTTYDCITSNFTTHINSHTLSTTMALV